MATFLLLLSLLLGENLLHGKRRALKAVKIPAFPFWHLSGRRKWQTKAAKEVLSFTSDALTSSIICRPTGGQAKSGLLWSLSSSSTRAILYSWSTFLGMNIEAKSSTRSRELEISPHTRCPMYMKSDHKSRCEKRNSIVVVVAVACKVHKTGRFGRVELLPAFYHHTSESTQNSWSFCAFQRDFLHICTLRGVVVAPSHSQRELLIGEAAANNKKRGSCRRS